MIMKWINFVCWLWFCTKVKSFFSSPSYGNDLPTHFRQTKVLMVDFWQGAGRRASWLQFLSTNTQSCGEQKKWYMALIDLWDRHWSSWVSIDNFFVVVVVLCKTWFTSEGSSSYKPMGQRKFKIYVLNVYIILDMIMHHDRALVDLYSSVKGILTEISENNIRKMNKQDAKFATQSRRV